MSTTDTTVTVDAPAPAVSSPEGEAKAIQPLLLPEERPEIEYRTILLSSLPDDDALLGPAPTLQLVEDVRRFGVVVPIAVVQRPSRKNKPGGYEVVAGRRRIKAARLAGLDEIPARVVDVSAKGAVPRTLTLLLQQQKPNPAAELAAIEGLLATGATEADIMRATGMQIGTIRQRLRLKRLNPELRKAMDAGVVANRQARVAATLSITQQEALVATLAETGKLTEADVHDARSAGVAAAFADLGLDALDALPSAFGSTEVPGLPPPPSFLATNGSTDVETIEVQRGDVDTVVGLLRDLLGVVDVDLGMLTRPVDEVPEAVRRARLFLGEYARA